MTRGDKRLSKQKLKGGNSIQDNMTRTQKAAPSSLKLLPPKR